MKSLAINFWPTCSNRCVFCFCTEHDLVAEDLTPPSVHSAADVGKALVANRNECDWVILSGNEPTLNPDLLVVIMLAKRIGYRVDLRTNGRRLKDRTFCRRLLKAGTDRINITLLSADADIHDALSGAPGAFADTVAGIRNLVSLGDPEAITVYIVVTRKNVAWLEKHVTYLHALGIRDIQFNCVYHTDSDVVPSLSDVEQPLQAAIRTAVGFGMRVQVYGFPACFLGEYAGLASELTKSNEVMLGSRITDYHSVRTDLGKRKTKYCAGCMAGPVCEGTWKSYYGIYGEEEFKKRAIKRGSIYPKDPKKKS
ncbi:MAG: radical SAM protein [Candidatus Moraniibacteriota bacterium]